MTQKQQRIAYAEKKAEEDVYPEGATPATILF